MPIFDENPNDDQNSQIDPKNKVYDPSFFVELRRWRRLRDALLRSENVLSAEARDACQLGNLNLLVETLYRKYGRQPTTEEWHNLEWRVQTLWDSLSLVGRKKFVLGESSPAFTIFCVSSGAMALLALVLGIGANIPGLPWLWIPNEYSYIMWLIALGAMGSVAFIGMNALSIQDDATFDLTNGRLASLRIILGALFGLVLSISVSFPSFVDLLNQLGKPGGTKPSEEPVKQTVYLLLPFILGFSTPLVIAVLNKFVDAIRTIFGLADTRSTTKQASNDANNARPAAAPKKPPAAPEVDEAHAPAAGTVHDIRQANDPAATAKISAT